MLKDDLLNMTDLAKKLNVSRTTIWRWVKDGLLIPKEMGSVKVYSYNKATNLKTRNKC
jgi:predicted DNA-binding transcriptional regulator AlpA